MWIDSHCHLADPRLDGRREALVAGARARGVRRFIQGGVGPQDWQRQDQLADASWVCAYGMHPWFVHDNPEETCRSAYADLLQRMPDFNVLGEIGLDRSPRMHPAHYDRQKQFFEMQLVLALQWDKPLILHVVRAHGDALTLLRKHGSKWRGMVHGFSGSKEVAMAYVDLGLAISVGGAVTRPGFRKLKDALQAIPRDYLCVESDAPDDAVKGEASKGPIAIFDVVEVLANHLDRTPRDLLSQSTANCNRIFNLEIES